MNMKARTYKDHSILRKSKTRRQSRRGLHEFLECYRGISGFNTTVGLAEFKTTYGEVTDAGIQILSNKFKAS